MKNRCGWRAAVLTAITCGLLVAVMGGPAAAKSTGSFSGSLTYSADNSGTFGGCYLATSSSAVNGRLDPSGAAVKGTLTINFASTGFSLCGPSSFQFATNGGTITGPVVSDDVNCFGGNPGPTNVCRLTLGLAATSGTGRFGGVEGQLLLSVDFTVVSGDFASGRFGTGGAGTISGTLAI